MKNTLTILVIGTLQDNLISMKAVIKEAFPEAKILTAQNGKKGLELAAIEDPDVILMEIFMPEMDGFEVCKKLKTDDLLKEIPVVFITALSENRENLIQALEAGAEGFVTTPVCEAEIIAQVRVMAKIKTANTLNRKEKQRLDTRKEVGTKEPENRKRIEAALYENEDNFRAVFESANVGKSITLPSGEINVNRAFCNMLGYEPEELKKKKWSDLTPSEDIEPTQIKLDMLLKGVKNEIRFEKRYIHKNGSYIWTDISVALHRDESGKPCYFITTVIDISERKRAENELLENQSRLSLFFNQSIYGYYATLLENPLDWEHLENKDEILDHIADHQFISEINDTMCVQYGLSKEQLMGRPISAFFKNDPENGRQFRKKLFDEGQFHIETLEYKADGNPVWIEGDYKCVYDSLHRIVGTLGIQIDITKRKLSEEALNENRAMLKMIVNTIPQSIFWKNTEGRYLGCNEVFAKAAGLNDPTEILGKTDYDLPWPKQETEAYRADDKEVIESQRPKLHIIEPLQQADGTRLWIDTSKVPLLDNSGKPIALLGIFDNITEKKLSQEKLLLSEEKFRNFFEESPIGIEIYNADGHLLQLNQACLEIFGVTDESEIKSFNLFDDPNVTDENKTRLKLGELIRYQAPFDFEKVKEYRLYQTSKSGISFLDVRITPLGETAADASGGFLVQVIDITDLKRAEKTLRDSEERYSLVYNASRDSIFSYDTFGRFTSVNQSFCNSLNLKPDQIIGRSIAELGFSEKLFQEFDKLNQQVYDSNDTVTAETTIPLPDGNLRNFEIVLNPLHDSNGNIIGIGGTTRDITEKKQAEEERLRLFKNEKAAREELNILLERISDGFVAFDNHMNYTFVNEAGAKLLGRDARDLVGKNYWQEFPEAKTTPFAKAYTKALETQEPIFIEEYYEPWDRWFANTIHPSDNGISIIFQEITERKKAEKALIENEKKFRSYVENAPEGIIVVNETGDYLEVNAATERITGFSRTELIGKNILDIIHSEDIKLAEQHFRLVSTTGEADGETRFITKNGEIRYWTVKAVKLTDNRLIGFVSDVTVRKQTEEALRESERKLKEAQHIAKLGNWELDLINNKLFWSDGIYQIFDEQKSSINVSYDDFLDAIYPDDRNKVNEAYETSLKSKTPYSVEHRLLTKSGNLKYVVENCITHYDIDGNPLRSVGTIQDITSQKLAGEQINELRNRYQSLFENSLIGTGLATADGKIIECNEAFATMLGRTIDEMKTLYVKGFYVNPEERTLMLEELSEKQVLKNFETKLKRNDGMLIDVLINISMVNLQGENYFQTTCLDITESKKAKEALQNEQHRLEGILYGTNAGTWEWNVQTGETIFNERWAEIIGYSLAEISPVSFETWLKFAHPEDIKASGELLQKHFSGEIDYYEFESRMRHKNGSWVWVLDRGRLISRTSDGKPLMIMGTHQDITSRKQAEEALREGETRYRSLLTNLDVGVVVHSHDTSITNYNHKALEILGLRDDQMSGKKAFDPQWNFLDENGEILPHRFYPVNLVADSKQILKNYIVGVNRTPDNQVAWLTVNGIPVNDEKGELAEILISFIDITGQKTFEKALQEKEERWRTIIRTSPDGIVVTSLEGKIMEISDNAFKMYNYASAEEVIGHDIVEYVHESDRQKSILSFSEILQGKYLGLSEFKVIKKDGTPFYVEINAEVIHDKSGNPQNIIFVQRDVTGRKRTETIQQVQYNVARSILTAESIEDLLEIVRKELSKVLDSSNLMVALYNPEQDTLKQLICSDKNDNSIEWEAQQSISGQVLKTGKTLFLSQPDLENFTSEHLLKLAGTPAFCWLGVPITIKNKVSGVMILQNYTNTEAFLQYDVALLEMIAHETGIYLEKKEMLEDIILAKDKAEESDKLKTSFLNNMSHEIRTPLNGILGFSNMLNNQGIAENTRQHYLNIIQQNSDQLIAIIEAIINISTIESGQEIVRESQTNINEILDNIYHEFKSRTNQSQIHLNYRTSLSLHDARVMTDQSKLIQILSQLLDNAIKFTDSGTIEMDCSINENTLLFSVSDTGIGIAAEFHQVIFDRFRKINQNRKREYGGNGLGLAISKAYVELLGGKIWLESELGKGSTFYFAIPYKPIFQGTKKQVDADNPILKNKTAKTLLIAEDEYSNYQLLEVILLREKHRIIHVLNGKEAVEKCLSNPDIAMVLMDLKMPVMDGLTATKLIKAQKPDLPIIAITAYALSGDKEKALEAGCDEYISKPIKKQDLLALINKF